MYIVNVMQDLPFLHNPAMQVDDFLKRKKVLLELDIKYVIWFPLVTQPYFCQETGRAEFLIFLQN